MCESPREDEPQEITGSGGITLPALSTIVRDEEGEGK